MHFSLSLDVAEDHESGAERREITGAFGSRGMLSTAFGVFLFCFFWPRDPSRLGLHCPAKASRRERFRAPRSLRVRTISHANGTSGDS